MIRLFLALLVIIAAMTFCIGHMVGKVQTEMSERLNATIGAVR